jgi:Type IV secretion system pilin
MNGADQINRLFETLLNFGAGIGVTAAAFFLMWGAFLYMSAGGSPRQMESGKSAMFNALIGLAVVLAARTLAGLIQRAAAGG